MAIPVVLTILYAKLVAVPMFTKIALAILAILHIHLAVTHVAGIGAVVYARQQGIISIDMHSNVTTHEKLVQRVAHLEMMRSANIVGECYNSSGCNDNGKCVIQDGVGLCECDDEHLTNDVNDPCNYKRSAKWFAFVIEFFPGIIGYSGGGWIYMSRGESDWMFALGIVEFLCHPSISTIWVCIVSVFLCLTIIGIIPAVFLIGVLPCMWIVWATLWCICWIWIFAGMNDGNGHKPYNGWNPYETWAN
jgi:energy-coupling factor transporter transmembrane protein EcfT